MVKIGDKVRYVPALGHAFESNSEGRCPFAFADAKDKPLAGKELEVKLKALFRQVKNRDEALSRLKIIGLDLPWTGVVTEVHSNGSVNLDVHGPRPWVTLHYCNIPLAAPESLTPHSYHLEGTELKSASPPPTEVKDESSPQKPKPRSQPTS